MTGDLPQRTGPAGDGAPVETRLEEAEAALAGERRTRFRETAALTRLLEERDEDRRRQEAGLAALRDEVARLAGRNRDLLDSTSWRITAPLRWIKRRLTGQAPPP